MPIVDHFGLIAPYYDHALPLHRVEQLIRLVDLPVQGRLLDVGGGTGRVAQALHDQVSQLVVIDESMGMLKQAKLKDSLDIICSHSESLPFPNDHFERVIMVDALHHVKEQKVTAGEIWRVVKPGGLVVILEPDIRRYAVKLVALMEKMLLMRSRFLSPERIAGLYRFSDAHPHIIDDGFNIWVCIRKS
jgi:demethylmenaquinone methyltransferase/2-methoxy-6-polyprenyl-1,4-benzoquinol methylase